MLDYPRGNLDTPIGGVLLYSWPLFSRPFLSHSTIDQSRKDKEYLNERLGCINLRLTKENVDL